MPRRHISNKSATSIRLLCSCGLILAIWGWTLAFIGCVGPPPQQSFPEVKTPEAWSVNWAGATNSLEGPWWKRFKDPELNLLITGALATNANLAVLAQRVELAQAEGRLSTAGAKPRVGAGTGLRTGRQRTRVTDYQTKSLKPVTASGSMDWEMDWLDKWRARHTAAQEKVRATEADLSTGRLLLAAEIANAWFSIRRHNEDQSIIEDSIKHQKAILAIYRDRLQAGLIDAAVIERQETEIVNLQRERIQVRMLGETAARRLDRLRGLPAGGNRYSTAPLRSGTIIPSLPVRLPTDILRQRPDLAAAEARVRSVFALERAAYLNLYPSLNLHLSGLTMTGSVTDPFQSWIAEVGPRLEIPIWDPKRIEQLGSEHARAGVVAAEYRALALRAFEEVETAAIQFNRRREQLQLAEEIVRKAGKVRTFTTDKLNAGLVSQLEVLEDERRILTARRHALTLHTELLADVVDIFRALGGP